MRIVVSGTHGTGKSTLISDFALRHPDFVVLPDPFELLDESWDGPSVASFAAQLRVSAARLHPDETTGSILAERGPLDFLAYLVALDDLAVAAVPRELIQRATEMTREAMRHVDLLVVLPISPADGIQVPDDEGLGLRERMNEVLLDLVDDGAVLGADVAVAENIGDRHMRLAALEAAVSARVGSSTPAPKAAT